MNALRVGIDASTLGDRGAATHLRELLSAAEPGEQGISEVVVWCSPSIAEELPKREWLVVKTPALLAGRRALRPFWPWIAHEEIRRSCAVLFVPGGLSFGRFSPFVAMSRNMLPFDKSERQRYGWSRTGVRLRVLESLLTVTFRRATGTVFLTRTARQVVQTRTGPLRNTVVIPHGVANAFRMPPREQKPLSTYSMERPFRWLYVSVVDLYKHQLEVAKAIVLLRTRRLPVALDMVGAAGPALPELQRFLAAHDPERGFLQFHGPAPYLELSAWYRDADAAVFASTCENMPNTLVEMMAAGLPIACSNRSVMPELFCDSGPTFDPENVDSVAAALEKLAIDPSLRAESARKSYALSQKYSWRRCADDTFAFLALTAHGTSSRGNP